MKPGSGEYLEIDGLRTYFVRKGTGPAIVMLHGQAAGASVHVIWDRTIEYFAAHGFRCYALDQAGFGRTDNDPTGDVSRKRRLRHIRAFIDAMGLDAYTLWGMSDGSNLSCWIALDDPRVQRLVLMASGSLSPRPPGSNPEEERRAAEERASYTPSLENARVYLQHHLVNHAAITDELVHELYEMSRGKNVESFQARAREVSTRPDYDDLQRITIPRLLLWGRQDTGGPIRGLLLQEKLPGSELHIFDRCGHWVNVDQFDRVNTIVCDFLQA
jgi:pimeloyl-ACP methyl ester carboxylesterase